MLAIALVLAATVAVQAAQASTIRACVKPKSGATRIVSAKAKCRHGERKMAWSTTGPAGPTGQAGSQGVEGKAGPNGAGALFSATSGAETELTSGSVVVTKTIPPGSYMVWAKSVVAAKSTKAGFEVSFCFLEDRPGTTNTGEATTLDEAGWSGELGEKEPTTFSGADTVPLLGAFTSAVTSTLSVVWVTVDDSPGVKVSTALNQLQALAVTSLG